MTYYLVTLFAAAAKFASAQDQVLADLVNG